MQRFLQVDLNTILCQTECFLKTDLLNPLEPRGCDSPVRRYASPKYPRLMENTRAAQLWSLGHSQERREAVLSTPARPKWRAFRGGRNLPQTDRLSYGAY